MQWPSKKSEQYNVILEPSRSVCPHSLVLETQAQAMRPECRGLNSGPVTCTVRTLLTVVSPAPEVPFMH